MSEAVWNLRREQLEAELLEAALNLFAHTGAASFKVPVPRTTPPLFIVASDRADLPPRPADVSLVIYEAMVALIGAEKKMGGLAQAIACHDSHDAALEKVRSVIPKLAEALQAAHKTVEVDETQWWEKVTKSPVPVLYTDSINGRGAQRDDLWIATTAQLSKLPPLLWCRNCEGRRIYRIHGKDLCCEQCHSIAASFHDRPEAA